MCYTVTCKKCGKTTWSGCGQHATQVMRNIAKAQRCQGHDSDTSTNSPRTTSTPTRRSRRGRY